MKLEHITVAFEGRPVLKDFSLELTAGSVNCLMGKSGSGKTTSLMLILGFLKPDHGLISGFSELRTGAVFQEDRLIEHLSARENVRLVTGKAVTAGRIDQALAEVELHEPAKPVAKLSGGQKRRVAIVRAMLFKPELLLLDEPFRALDGDTKRITADFIRARTDGATVLIVTHDREDALMLGANRIITMPEIS